MRATTTVSRFSRWSCWKAATWRSGSSRGRCRPWRRRVTLEMVRSLPPPRLSVGQAKRRLDLEAICLKCLAKDPGRRYASAAELAHDLGEWRRERRTVAGAQRKTRLVSRRTVLVGLGVGGVAALAGLGYFWRGWKRPATELVEALEGGENVELIGKTGGGPRWDYGS